jgi:autotransporter-associated beta strand protein
LPSTVVYTVTTEAQLQAAIENANANAAGVANYQIVIGSAGAPATINLTSDLPLIALAGGSTLTIDGNGSTIDGQGTYRGLFADSGSTTVDNLNIDDTKAQGGAGGSAGGGAGGGGAGLGGGLFVGGGASVDLNNVNFANTSAVGGAGGLGGVSGGGAGGGGGGGMGGVGGNASNSNWGGGGGGGLGVGANGSPNFDTTRDGGAGSAVGMAAGGGGGWSDYTVHYVVTSSTDYNHGGNAGANGGAGGDGYNNSGGGGGIGGQTPSTFYLGSRGFELSLSFSPLGLATDLLQVFEVIDPETALALTVVLGLYSFLGGNLGAPGFLNDLNLNISGNGVSTGSQPGGSVPGLSKLLSTASGGALKYMYGFGLHYELGQYGPQGNPPPGGDGGFGGGGGGGSQYASGGFGGFGGGGGGAGQGNGTYGGFGGFGGFGGGGGGYVATPNTNSNGQSTPTSGPGIPGFGAGATTGVNGGGGLGAGGAIFVEQGGTLTYGGGDISDASVEGGAAGGANSDAGSAYGQGVFLQGDSTLNLAPAAGQTMEMGPIADQAGSDSAYDLAADEGSVVIDGPGTVVFNGDNTYLGGTTVEGGATLDLAAGAYLGGALTIVSGQLDLASSASFNGDLTLESGEVQVASGDTLAGVLTIQSGQVVIGASVSLSGLTAIFIQGGSLQFGANDTLAANIYVQNDSSSAISALLGAGSKFTGQINGLGASQYLYFGQDLGGDGLFDNELSQYNYSSTSNFNNDFNRLDGKSFVYGVETLSNGAWVTDVHSADSQASEANFTVGNDLQLADLLRWFVGSGDFLYDYNPLTINLAPGPNSASALVNAESSNLFYEGSEGGQGVTIEVSGQLADGGGADPYTTETLQGSTFLLYDSSTRFEAGAGQTLIVDPSIIQAYGNSNGEEGITVGASGMTGRVVLDGVDTFNAGLNLESGTLELGSIQAAGHGSINFGGGANATLQIDGPTLLPNAIAGFATGDALDLTGFTHAAGWTTASPSGVLTLNAVQALALNFAGLAPGSRFAFASDGQGGLLITSLDYYETASTFAALAAAFQTIPSLTGADVHLTLSGGGTMQAAGPIPVPTLPTSGVLTVTGNGETISGGGAVSTGLSFSSGTVTLQNLTLSGFTQTPLSVAAGGRVQLQSVTLSGQAQVAAGGLLVLQGGSIGAVGAAGEFSAAPYQGQAATLTGAVAGDLHVGDTAATVLDVPTLVGGDVVAQAGVSVSGTVYLDTDTTLELQAGATLGGAPIVFDSPDGAILKIDGTALPSNTISFADNAGEIDLARVSVTGSHVVTVQTGGLVNIPGATGQLHFGSGVTVGEQFLVAQDGSGGALLTPVAQAVTVSSEAQLAALANYAAGLPAGGLPAGGALTLNVALAGVVALNNADSQIKPPSGVQVSLQDAAGTTGGLSLGGQVSYTLNGTNTFSGGITFAGRDSLTAASAASLGSGAITFNGANDALTIGGTADPANTLSGFIASDSIDLTGIAPAQTGYVYTDFNDVATFSSTAGPVSLNFTGLPLNTPISIAHDGHGGTLITTVGRETFTVATEAQLDAAITAADAFQGETLIQFAPGADIALTHVLPAISLQKDMSVEIDGQGGTLDGQGQWGGFYAASGQVAIANLTLSNMLAKGQDGQSGYWAGGGGGAGLGGALFIGAAASVDLTGVSFLGDEAIGGAGAIQQEGAPVTDGSGGISDANTSARGVLGNGAGGNNTYSGGDGGFGGYGNRQGSGGDGAGLGGAIFMQQGGALTIYGSIAESGGLAAGGQPSFSVWYGPYGAPGLGAAIFSQGSATLNFAPQAGQTDALADSISDPFANGASSGSISITLNGAGVLELDGNNSYSGTTTAQSGTLILTGALSGLAGAIVDNSTVELNQTSDTTFSGGISGTGSLSLDGDATDTFTGSVSLAGPISLLAGGLTYRGSSLSAAGITDDGVFTAGGLNALTVATPISGTGDFVYDDTNASTFSYLETTGALTVDAGALTLAAPAAVSSVTLNGGTLTLESSLTNATQVAFGDGAGAELIVGPNAALPQTLTGFNFGDTLDVQGQVFVSATLLAGNVLQLTTASGSQTDIVVDPGVDLSSSSSINLGSTVFNLTSDGAGGTVVRPVPAQLEIQTQADLNNAISSFDVGGSAYQANFDYGLDIVYEVDGGLTIDAPIPAINLGPGSALFINTPLYLGDSTGEGGNPVFEIQSGSVTVDAHGQLVGTEGVGVQIDAGTSLTIENPEAGSSLGYQSPTGVTDNGVLDVSGGLLFDGLQGSGQLILNDGSYEFQDAFGGGGNVYSNFSGALTLNNASTDVILAGLTSLTLGPSSTTWVYRLPTTVTFEAGVTDRLYVDTLSGSNTTIYGFEPGDVIELSEEQSSGDGGFSIEPGTAQLGAGNVLTFTLWQGSAYGQFKSATIHFDPNQNFAGYSFGVSDGGYALSLQPVSFIANSGSQLVSDLFATSSWGSAGAPNTDYTIKVGADLTGALGVSSVGSLAYEIYSPPSGSQVVVDGQGHTVSGLNIYVPTGLTLENLNLVNSNLGVSPGAVLRDVSASSLDSGYIQYIGTQGYDAVGQIHLVVDAGQTETIGHITTDFDGEDGQVVIDGAGTLRLTGNNAFTDGILLNGGGVLELGAPDAAGKGNWGDYYDQNVGKIFLNSNAEIVIDGALNRTEVGGLAYGNGSLDFRSIAPSAMSFTRSLFDNGNGTEFYTNLIGGSVYLPTIPGPLTVASDGQGGTLVEVAHTSFTATDEATLNTVLAELNLYGAQSAPGVGETLTLDPPSGVIGLYSLVQPVALASGAGLTIQGGGTTLDGGGGAESGLAFSAGQFAVDNLTFSDFAPNQTALSVSGTASVTLSGVDFTDGSDQAPVISVGAGASLAIDGGQFAAGSVIELGAGAKLALDAAQGATFVVAAAIDDPAGDGTGTGEGAVTVSGAVDLEAASDFSGGLTVNGRLELDAAGAAGEGAITLGAGGTLAVAPGVTVANAITGLTSGGAIDVEGLVVTGASLSGQSLTLSGAGSSETLDIADAGLNLNDLVVASDGNGGSLITYSARTLAVPSAPTTLALGSIHEGVPLNERIGIGDNAGQGGDFLVGGFGALGTGLSANNSLDLAPGQGGGLNLVVDPTADGAYAEAADYAFTSDGTNRLPVAVSTSPLEITAAVYAYAVPVLPVIVNLGVGRVGGGDLTRSVTIENIGTAGDSYQESLGYSVSGFTDSALGFTGASGSVLAGSSGSMGITYNPATATAGGFADVGSVNLVSLAVPGSGLSNTSLNSSGLVIEGELFNPAVAQLPSTVNFGVAHVGDAPDVQGLTITNVVQAGPFSDSLSASVQSLLTGYSVSGSAAGLTPGDASTLTLTLATSQSGLFDGQALLSLASSDPDQPDLVTQQTVNLVGAVDNYAVAALSQTSGGGTLTGSGNAYTLDLGSILTPTTATFAIANAAPGLADLLSGGFTVSGAPGVANTGVGGFSGLGAGQSADFSVTVTPTVGGDVSETLAITPKGSNASGYSETLPSITLTIKAEVETTSFVASSESELNTIISDINAGGDLAQSNKNYTITLDPAGETLTLTSALTAVDLSSGSSLSILGDGDTISGGGQYQGFVDAAGSLELDDLTLSNLVAIGGTGGSAQYGGGGGGAGLGGALYVASGASATLDGVSFVDDSAEGGVGGGVNASVTGVGGAGGGADAGGAVTASSPVPGGQGGSGIYTAYYVTIETQNGPEYFDPYPTGGQQGGFGGGGGSIVDDNGSTGYGPGGNSGGSQFGGGAGAEYFGFSAPGGYDGGVSSQGYGGGGMAAGADVFVQQGGSVSFDSGDLGAGGLTGGAGGGSGATTGAAAGTSLFWQGGGTIDLDPLAGQTMEIDGTIASDSGAALSIGGGGTVRITHAQSYTGGTTVASTLDLAVAGAAGSGEITLDEGSTLEIETTGAFANEVAGLAGATLDAAGVSNGSVQLSDDVLTVTNGTTSLTLTLAESNLSVYGFSTAADGHGGTLVTYAPTETLVTPEVSETSFDFGNVHVGTVSSASFNVSNPLLQGGDTLLGGFGAAPSPMSGSGSLDVAPGGSGSLTVGLTATTTGAVSLSAPLALESEGPTGNLTSVSAPSITVTETVFALAAPSVFVTGFGPTRVGDSLTGQLIVSDGTSASAYQESLLYSLGSASSGVTVDGAASGTVASGASTSIGLSLSTATAGTITASLPVGFTSTGAGTSGLANTALPGRTVQVSADVWAPAVAEFATSVDLGWGHVGDTLTGALSVTNGASGALTDSLSASWNSVTAGFIGSSAIAGLGAGSSSDLGLAITGTTSGMATGSASLALASHDAELADLNSTSAPITLTATFLNYAELGVGEVSGGGTWTQSGSNYTLNLGTITGPDTINLSVFNAATGLSDLLSGSFSASGTTDVWSAAWTASAGSPRARRTTRLRSPSRRSSAAPSPRPSPSTGPAPTPTAIPARSGRPRSPSPASSPAP